MNSAHAALVTTCGNAPKGALLLIVTGAEMWTYLKGEQDSFGCRIAVMATYLPFSDVVAAYGYREPVARQRGNVFLLAFAYTVMGGALGTVAGTGLAMATSQTSLPTLSFQVSPTVEASANADHMVARAAEPSLAGNPMSAPVTASAPAVKSAPAFLAKPSPVKLAKTAVQVRVHPVAPAVRVASVDRVTPVAHVSVLKPAAHSSVAPSTQDFAKAAALPTQAAAPVVPAVKSTAAGYQFFSEGDVTVADFDATTGTIESYEGRTFVLNSTTATLAGAALEDSGSSVHYRCDQSGSCTLMRAGLVMQNVRLE